MNRQTYVEQLSARMMEWDVKIDLLKDKAKIASPEIRHECAAAIAALQVKRDEAAAKLQGVESSSDDEWEQLKEGTERVWGEISTILHDAVMKIK